MLNRLRAALRAPFRRQACVLMYHRVAEPATDIWKIAVSSVHFEEHLRLLRREATVVSLPELVTQLARGTVPRKCVALTFDDGYADNFLVAKPLLDAYQLPATFFIASGYTDQAREFWWDELEHLVLGSSVLPATLPPTPLLGQAQPFALGPEVHLTDELRAQHGSWDACAAPAPTRRAALLLELWRHLQPLPEVRQQLGLSFLRHWVGGEPSARPAYRSLSSEQVRALAASPLHSVGVHTVSHPALAFHPPATQRQELVDNRSFLEELTGLPARLVAYPYGLYNEDTLALAAANGFQAGFTTEARPVNAQSDPYRLGRFQVPDVPAAVLAPQLHAWQTAS